MGIAMFDQIYINNETNNAAQKTDTEQKGDSSKKLGENTMISKPHLQ